MRVVARGASPCWRFVGAVALGGLMLGAGCGSRPPPAHEEPITSISIPSTTLDPNSTTTTAVSPELAQARLIFIGEAEAMCAESFERIAELQRQVESAPALSAEEAIALVEQQASITESLNAEMRSLTRPPGDEAALEMMFATVDEYVAFIRSFTSVVTSDDQVLIRDMFIDVESKRLATNRAFLAYGLKTCGS